MTREGNLDPGMHMRLFGLALAMPLLLACAPSEPSGQATPASPAEAVVQHVTVAAESNRFKGWPASSGMWSWNDEILVSYVDCRLDRTTDGHARTPPCFTEQARSTDGGVTWLIEEQRTQPALEEPVDFTHPDFAFGIIVSDTAPGPHFSYDRGRHWIELEWPQFELVREECPDTDYIVNGPRDMMWFNYFCSPASRHMDTLTGVHTYERPFLIRTRDGGLTWSFVSPVTGVAREPNAPGVYYGEEPSSVRLSPTKLLSLSRWFRDDGTEPWPTWMEAWTSEDDGESWSFTSRVSDGPGTRPHLVTLPDGRLVLTYEHRAAPYGIRARISDDEGARWSDPFILRADGGNWDIGYTRNALRPDGKLVTVYYYNFEEHGPRSIEATIWDPDVAFPP